MAENNKKKYSKEINEWIGTTLLPFILILIIWPAYWILFKKPFNFQRVLSGGDLFAICFTILLSAYTEFSLKQNSLQKKQSASISKIEKKKQWTIFYFVVAFAAYLVIKIAIFNLEIPGENEKEIDSDLTAFSCTSILYSLLILKFILDAKLEIENLN